MDKKGKLELTWVGKNDEKELEPRILVEDKEKSYGDQNTGNMLIHGDNLLALKALEQEYTGKVKCIYIDPPYNTGNAFDLYDDGLEHSIWLSMMHKRLIILSKLLKENGIIFIQIDDTEMAYLKIICDEIFGRDNYVNTIAVNTKVSAGASGGGEDKKLKKNIEYILVYCKDMNSMPQFKPIYKRTELMDYIEQMKTDNKSFKYTSVLYKIGGFEYYKTISDGSGEDIIISKINDYKILSVKQLALQEHISEKEVYEKYYDKIMTTTNAQTSIRTRVWNATDSENNMYKATYVPRSGKNKGIRTDLYFMGKQKVLLIWLSATAEHLKNKIYKKERIGTFWDGFSWINVTKEGQVLFPNGKKPEGLIQRVLEMATNEGDLVLDSFLGSGTTCAVAQKMNRKWIGIELREHAYTLCKVRLDNVINGTDKGGISKEVSWFGGGGYKFYELADPLLVKNAVLPVYQINPIYTWDMVSEAICKIEGFTYAPEGEFQGHSSENRFIHITQEYVNSKYVMSIMKNLGEKQSLLIYCKKFQAGIRLPENVEIKKIPKDLLDKCNFDEDSEVSE